MRITGVLPQKISGGDAGMIVTASFPYSFADISYKGEILRNRSIT